MANLEAEQYEKYTELLEIIGAEGLLEEVIKALPNDTVMDVLGFIARNHDIDF